MSARYAISSRVSLPSAAAEASFSARSAESSSRAISRSSAACALSLPLRARLSKLILAPDDEDLAIREHAPQERLAGRELSTELQRRIDVRVDLAAQDLLRRRECSHDVGEPDLADHHQVDVAAGALIAA